MFDIEKAIEELQEVAQMKPVPFGTGGKMFDPEKVERFTDEGDSLSVFPHSDPHFVLSSDYDQLLELYRAAAGPNVINALKLGQHDHKIT